MPWEERSVLEQRRDLIVLLSGGMSLSEASRRCNVSRETARFWRDRFAEGGIDALNDLSRRPHSSPGRTDARVEKAVVRLRTRFPAWGGRKIAAVLLNDGFGRIAPSTVTDILRRNMLLGECTPRPVCVGRFERSRPNELWQMDYKSPFVTADGRGWHPLTIIDDHSRYALAVRWCKDQTLTTLLPQLRRCLRVYGLPEQILCDNGSPWRGDDPEGRLSRCEIWLMDRGVEMIHGRPRHPQTQGKDERFHRTLDVELLQGRTFADGGAAMRATERWRDVYNHRRPHDALDMKVPAQRYSASPRPFVDRPQPWDYSPDDAVRRVWKPGRLSFCGRTFRVGKALEGRDVGVRPTDRDGVYEVRYRKLLVRRIDLRAAPDGDMR